MAVASMLEDGDFSFDVVHCHDWQTGLIPALIKCRDIPVKTVYTIHNLQYQGIFPWNEVQDYLSLPYEYFGDGRIEFYGQVNFMKAGITFADKVTTVSETYAEEIKYPYFGERLDGLIVSRGDVTGIVNGVDYDFYSPKNNEYLFKKYTVNNFKAGKAENKAELQKLLGLEQNPDVMMIGMVGRLSRQKGLELVEYVFDEIMGLGVQFVIIGVGEPHFEELFRYYAWQYSGRVSANIMFQNDRAHKIYAGADAFAGEREGDHDNPVVDAPESDAEVGQRVDFEFDFLVVGKGFVVEWFLFGHGVFLDRMERMRRMNRMPVSRITLHWGGVT